MDCFPGILYILLTWQIVCVFADEKCESIITPNLKDCKANGFRSPVRPCVHNVVCNKTFYVSTVGIRTNIF